MKKASKNLVLRSETLRTLVSVDLAGVAGGLESGTYTTQSGDKQCVKAIAGNDSGDKQCPK